MQRAKVAIEIRAKHSKTLGTHTQRDLSSEESMLSPTQQENGGGSADIGITLLNATGTPPVEHVRLQISNGDH